MSAIFISHSSKDNEMAAEVKDRLAEQGHRSIFLDFDPEFGIPPGRSWEQELYQQLRACQAVIVLCSEHSMASHWSFAEVTHAKALGKHIFPIKIGDCIINTVLTSHQVLDLTQDKEEAYRRLWRGLKQAGLDPANAFDWDGSRPPYPGLLAFQEADAAVFFGRDKEIQMGLDLLQRLRQFGGARMVMVLGASGSGKSSLVRAGLVPRLRPKQDEWLVVDPFRPRGRELQELAIVLAEAFKRNGDTRGWRDIRDALEPAADAEPVRGDILIDLVEDLRITAGRREATVLLVIDQTEELLGYDQNVKERHFLPLLRAALDARHSPLMAICTLRSDFLGAFQQHRAVRDLPFEDLKVGPISKEGLVQVIEGPAEKAGIRLETGLTQALVADTETEDALPLLAFTLRELYERYGKDDKLLEIEEYRDQLGGLVGSVKKAADAVFAARPLAPEELVDLRNAFLAMVRVNEEGQYARRAARWIDLPERIHELLERFVQARLLISRGEEGEERVLEVAHEALFRSWDRLRTWLEEDRDRLRLRERLRQAAKEWENNDRDPNLLVHRGSRLQDAEALLQMPRFAFSEWETAYIEACVAQREATRAAERRRADTARVAIATDWLARDPTMAALVLLEVEDPNNTPFAISRMNETLGHRLLYVELKGHGEEVNSASFSPDGQHIVSASYSDVRVWRADGSGAPIVLKHDESVYSASFSPDGQYIVSASFGEARVWRADGSGRPVVLQHNESVNSASFSPHGQHIVTVSHDEVRVWQADGSGEPVVLRHDDRVRSAVFSPDGERVVTASEDGAGRVWRADGSGEPVVLRHEGTVNAAMFSPDGEHIMTASIDGEVRVWRADGSGQPIVLGHEGGVRDATYSPDGEQILTVSYLNAVSVWPADGSGEPVVLQHERLVHSAMFSPDGKRVVTASEDGTARVWFADGSGQPVVLQHGYYEDRREVNTASFSPDGERIVTASADGIVRVWWAGGSEPLVLRHERRVRAASFSPDGQHVVTASEDGTARIWQADGTGEPVVFQHEDWVTSAVFSPDGERIVTVSRDTARMWRSRGSGQPVELRHDAQVTLARFSPDGERVLTASRDGLVRVWRSDASGDPVVLGPPGSYKGTLEINAAEFSPDGDRVVAASGPMTRVWRSDGAGEPMVLMARHYGGYIERVTQALFSPDGDRILTILEGGKVRVWLADGSGEPVVLQDGGNAATFSPDGERVVVASADSTVRVWRADGAGEPVVFRHDAAVNAATFSPDGKRVVTASEDGTGQVWQADGSGVPVVLRHEAGVMAAMFSPDGQRVVTVSADDTIRVWRIDGTLLQKAIQAATCLCLDPEFRERYLGETPEEARRMYEACQRAHGREPEIMPPRQTWRDERLPSSAISPPAP